MYLLCKLLFAGVFSLVVAAPTYLPLYYHDTLHLSPEQIGLVIAIAPFVQSVACPFWTYIVDQRPRYHGPIMAFASFCGGIALLGIMVLGWSQSEPNILPASDMPRAEEQQSSASTVRVMWIASLCALAFAFFTMPNTSLVDSAVIKMLGRNKVLYGTLVIRAENQSYYLVRCLTLQ